MDFDKHLRDQLFAKLIGKVQSKVIIERDGRGGKLIYNRNDEARQFEIEMGRDNCLFFVLIPSAADWESQTGMVLTKRDEYLNDMAEAIRFQHAQGCTFEISSSAISFFRS